VKTSQASPAGWYPDPEGGSRLRWWEGTDWSDRYRARPYAGTNPYVAPTPHAPRANPAHVSLDITNASDPQAWVEQMRAAARSEADRAVQQVDQRFRQARAEFKPLITEYTSKLMRFLKVMAFLAVLLIVAWIVVQVVAQQSLFEWIGDRIDNVTDDTASWPRAG
jgi:hypothetical protein